MGDTLPNEKTFTYSGSCVGIAWFGIRDICLLRLPRPPGTGQRDRLVAGIA